MKSIKRLLAAVLSVAMLGAFATTSFAAVLDYTNEIEFKAVVSPATVAPGEDVTVSVYVTDKTYNDGVVLTAGGGIIVKIFEDETKFTYKSSEKTQNYGTVTFDKKADGSIYYMLDTTDTCTIDKDTALFKCVYTVNEGVTAGTYDVVTEMSDAYIGDLEGGIAGSYVYDYDVDVTVKAAEEEKDEKVTAGTSAAGATKITYGKDYTGSKALDGKYLVKADLGAAVLDKNTTFTVTYDNTTKPFGASMWEDLGIENNGTLEANKIIVAVAFDFDVNPAYVTIAIAE